MSPRRVTTATLFALLPALGAAKPVFDFYAEHRSAVELAARVPVLEQRVANYEARIARLERWNCRLGWDPPRTRDSSRDCRPPESPAEGEP